MKGKKRQTMNVHTIEWTIVNDIVPLPFTLKEKIEIAKMLYEKEKNEPA